MPRPVMPIKGVLKWTRAKGNTASFNAKIDGKIVATLCRYGGVNKVSSWEWRFMDGSGGWVRDQGLESFVEAKQLVEQIIQYKQETREWNEPEKQKRQTAEEKRKEELEEMQEQYERDNEDAEMPGGFQ